MWASEKQGFAKISKIIMSSYYIIRLRYRLTYKKGGGGTPYMYVYNEYVATGIN